MKIPLMENNIRSSLNNTFASPVCEIKRNLGEIAHFIVKETHRLHSSVTERVIAKLQSSLFQCFITRPLLINTFRYLALYNFLNGSFNKYQTRFLIFNIPTKFDSEKTSRMLFHRGVRQNTLLFYWIFETLAFVNGGGRTITNLFTKLPWPCTLPCHKIINLYKMLYWYIQSWNFQTTIVNSRRVQTNYKIPCLKKITILEANNPTIAQWKHL